MTLDSLAVAVTLIGIVGLVGWMLAGLLSALRHERARQPLTHRTSLPLVITAAALIVTAAAWLTDDPRTGFRFAMGGLAAAALIDTAIRRRQAKKR